MSRKYEVYEIIFKSGGELSAKNLSDETGLAPGHVQRILYTLVKEGAACRRASKNDKSRFVYFLGQSKPAQKTKDEKDSITRIKTQPFINHSKLSGQFALGRFSCNKELTARIEPKPYVPPKNKPNYAPRQTSFYTSGQGKFAGEPK
jgi:hypothetical protein